jgi:hypothetical protein
MWLRSCGLSEWWRCIALCVCNTYPTCRPIRREGKEPTQQMLSVLSSVSSQHRRRASHVCPLHLRIEVLHQITSTNMRTVSQGLEFGKLDLLNGLKPRSDAHIRRDLSECCSGIDIGSFCRHDFTHSPQYCNRFYSGVILDEHRMNHDA